MATYRQVLKVLIVRQDDEYPYLEKCFSYKLPKTRADVLQEAHNWLLNEFYNDADMLCNIDSISWSFHRVKNLQ